MIKQILVAALFVVACGKPGEGEECEHSNSTDDCDDGLVCTKETAKTVCRLLCDDANVVCPTGTTCNGVANGNHKSCQP